MSGTSALRSTDAAIYDLIRQEDRRQVESIRLIASENYTSAAVLEAAGSSLSNKYSEGYPGRRYYEGQEFIDQIETLAIERAKALFGAAHANVQAYSGSPANQAVYLALLEAGDTVMGLGLPFGGHLTHGWKVNFSGRLYRAVQYDVDRETHLIDLNRVEELGEKLDPVGLAEIADLSPVPWSQRLGYILDLVEHSTRGEQLASFVEARVTETAPLIPSAETSSARRDDRWKLWINADLEPDL